MPEPEPAVKNRTHLDLATTSPDDQAELVAHLTALGAAPVDVGQGEVPWRCLADPEGTEFCVLEPREVYRDTGPIAAVVADCADPRAMARFWGAATDWPVRRATGDLAVLRCPGQGPLPRVPPGARPEDRAVSWTCPTDPEGHEFRVLTRS
ncbi:VOC family protein [Streptomyces griseofuscus]|uniref:VOC family protein n=1 Tax=Streptomyces griseofuscus TaxID=146922 RepID=UPI0031456686